MLLNRNTIALLASPLVALVMAGIAEVLFVKIAGWPVRPAYGLMIVAGVYARLKEE